MNGGATRKRKARSIGLIDRGRLPEARTPRHEWRGYTQAESPVNQAGLAEAGSLQPHLWGFVLAFSPAIYGGAGRAPRGRVSARGAKGLRPLNPGKKNNWPRPLRLPLRYEGS